MRRAAKADRETTRLFFALWPDAAARRALAAAARGAQRECGGRAMQPRSLHLTLAFLGDTDPAARDAAIAAAGDVGVVPFEFVIDRSGFFRQGRERGVLWAGGGAPAALEALASDLRARLAATGVPFDRKAFVPHVTLLRGARAPLAPIAIAPIVWRVRDFALVASTRDAGGPVYRSLARPFGSSR